MYVYYKSVNKLLILKCNTLTTPMNLITCACYFDLSKP